MQTGARIPISWKRGFRGIGVLKPPFPLVLEKAQKSPFPARESMENGDFLTENSPFPECVRGEGRVCKGEGKWGSFGPRKLTKKPSSENGIRASVWGRGLPTVDLKLVLLIL